MQAGLGGGSSNAAATLVAVGGDLGRDSVARLARSLGSDVPLFLSGGSQWMRGTGESLEPWPPLSGFAVAVVVPPFGFDTAEVYRRWDELEGPMGEPLPSDRVPPALRELPLRNDLLPAALDLEPLLGDFLADLRALWGTPVSMTGSGSACFGYVATLDEAEDAASSVSDLTRAGRGMELRDRGVKASDHHDG